MIQRIRKRDGTVVDCDGRKITTAILKAAKAVGAEIQKPEEITASVLRTAFQKNGIPTSAEAKAEVGVEQIQDLVEYALMGQGYPDVAKAYILYREQRRKAREGRILIDATTKMFTDYLHDKDWQIKENANTRKSINGMNNYIRESFTKQYWLHEIYPQEIRQAHINGDFHIHDLGFFGPYCCGWDLYQLAVMGFGGVPGKVTSKPAKHLRSFLGQIVNATFSTQGESAGAQAWSSIDTYCAPFIRADALTYAQVKQALQEFVFNLNVPTRVGFQSPFSNLSFDLKVPSTLTAKNAIVGGLPLDTCYGDYQKEMDLFNLAFCEVMIEGDASGRVFTFPIPTYNITKEFAWDGPVFDSIMTMTAKYGIPYFSNYINSDLSPEDALSMCCRLRLDTSELRKRGGGLFGSNPLTGSIGVVTLNLPRLAHQSLDRNDFFERLAALARLAMESLEIKRKVIERETERGMYPFSARWLYDIRQREGAFWANHFSTIGLVGMHEACLNLKGLETGIETEAGKTFAVSVLSTLRELVSEFQKETGHYYNLEATPAEGTSHRLAKLDVEQYPSIRTSGIGVPYYTNSTQLPVDFSDDIFQTLDLQDELQSLYTGGTVLHLYLGERIEDRSVAKKLIKTVFSRYRLPYLSITPTFSTCEDHGYLTGEVPRCPVCGKETEVWTRVVGYLRPVRDFHEGKREEHRQRRPFTLQAL
ncbi:Anaerobic ribonucleoside-triphosphate reductase [bioreactor metagenome]|jgi:ribonucleoside-triphosphate reductase|uniref:Anaerobic ribonucleoside-triphosphate reductase n=1 Tax=bioreactor metagenome TaxID=1076179 RepID=A0A644SYQ0_9ZZZZ